MIRTSLECFPLDTKRPVSFPLEDKHAMNERHVARKSHDATQKKCSHVVHFKVPRDWFETNLRHQKRYSKGGKKICGRRGLLGRVIGRGRGSNKLLYKEALPQAHNLVNFRVFSFRHKTSGKLST